MKNGVLSSSDVGKQSRNLELPTTVMKIYEVDVLSRFFTEVKFYSESQHIQSLLY
jgi:hypothetical protein